MIKGDIKEAFCSETIFQKNQPLTAQLTNKGFFPKIIKNVKQETILCLQTNPV